MFRFKVKAGVKVGPCTSDDPRWEAMKNVLFFHANNSPYLAACSEKSLAFVPVEADGQLPDKPILLPADAVNANGKDKMCEVNGELRTSDGKKTEVAALPEKNGKFPALRQVMPEVKDLTTFLTIDVKLLKKLADAISGNGVITLGFQATNDKGEIIRAFAVMDSSQEDSIGGFGVMMPMGLKDQAASMRTSYELRRADVPQESISFTAAVQNSD